MPAGAWVIPDKTLLNLVSPTNLLSANVANYRLALVGSGYAPNNAIDEFWSHASGAEIANGNGYITGGKTPATFSLTQTAGVVKWTWDTGSFWTAAGGSIPAWRRVVLYYLGILNGKTNPMIAHALGDSTGIDVPITTVGNSIVITPNVSGVLTISRAA